MTGQRRDRTGEPIETDDEDDDQHRCQNGWIDRNADRPVPCPECKPWVVQRKAPPGSRLGEPPVWRPRS